MDVKHIDTLERPVCKIRCSCYIQLLYMSSDLIAKWTHLVGHVELRILVIRIYSPSGNIILYNSICCHLDIFRQIISVKSLNITTFYLHIANTRGQNIQFKQNNLKDENLFCFTCVRIT